MILLCARIVIKFAMSSPKGATLCTKVLLVSVITPLKFTRPPPPAAVFCAMVLLVAMTLAPRVDQTPAVVSRRVGNNHTLGQLDSTVDNTPSTAFSGAVVTEGEIDPFQHPTLVVKPTARVSRVPGDDIAEQGCSAAVVHPPACSGGGVADETAVGKVQLAGGGIAYAATEEGFIVGYDPIC